MAKAYTALTAPAVTALNGLAAGAYWVSPNVNNGTNLAYEMELFLTLVTTTTSVTSGSFKVYIAGSVDGGTDYAGGITTQSDAVYTPAGDDVSEWTPITSLIYTTEITARILNKHTIFDDIPKDFKYVIFNDTGEALAASGCALEHNKITY